MMRIAAVGEAVISECGLYRYRLERESLGDGQTAVIMVNPSTADAVTDDATIRKLRGFGERHGWGRIIVGNLFAYRATDVRDLAHVADPIGPENDQHLLRIAAEADQAIFAWGPVTKQPRAVRQRWERVADIFVHLRPLAIGAPAKCGHPRHPLMLAYAEPLLPWSPPA
jgi:hypothetical protein